jgi:hypothetical protein
MSNPLGQQTLPETLLPPIPASAPSELVPWESDSIRWKELWFDLVSPITTPFTARGRIGSER